MRTALRRGAIAAVAAGALLLATGTSAAPEVVGVNGGEYYLTLSKLRVDPGRTTIEFVNDGEDAHNLLLKRKGDPKKTIASELGAGGVDDRTVKLKRGSRYRLWCSLTNPVDHDLAGMSATLRVRKHG
jgi:plastocyanin